jgi:hypothetical protein
MQSSLITKTLVDDPDRLFIRDGEIRYKLKPDQPSNGMPSELPVVSHGPITPVEKLDPISRNGLTHYRFRWNTSPDRFWHSCVQSIVVQDGRVMIGGELGIICSPGDLESLYNSAKQTVAKVNQLYEEVIVELRNMAQKIDTDRQAKLQKIASQEAEAKKALDALKL